MGREKIYVIGHVNPDTDSVCSAIAYARLRQQQGLDGVIAARAGNINRQTEFVLNELAVPRPQLLLDVAPRISDVIAGQQPITVPAAAPLARALELFHLYHVRILPVVDEQRRPCGMVYLKRVSERFMVPGDSADLRRVLASPRSICQCLKGSLLCESAPDVEEELNLYVAAMSDETFSAKLSGIDPRGMILICGDREEILRIAVRRQVRVVVVVGELDVANDVVDQARANGVTIISTAYDSATATWLTRLATPVLAVSEQDYISLRPQDSVEKLRVSLMHSSVPGVVIVNEDGVLEAVATKGDLLSPSAKKLILVDHNELTQAVSGADKVEIIEIVDHHRLGSLQTDKPIRFINQPLGSTCTLVATLYRDADITPDPSTAGLMLAGLLSDTVVMKSPTTTDVDREIANWLGTLAGLDPYEFGRRIFASSSAMSVYDSLKEVITTDFKVFGSEKCRFGIGQVEVVNFHEFHNLQAELEQHLEAVRRERELAMVGLLVTDIVAGNSELLVCGEAQLTCAIGYPQLAENLFELRGVLSRKKQLIPHLLRVFGDV